MKKTLLFIFSLFICFTAMSQSHKEKVAQRLNSIDGLWEKDNNGSIYVQQIIDFERLTKEQLYVLTKEHFVNAYRDANSVIQMDDKENGIIIGKGCYRDIACVDIFAGSAIKYTFWHIFKCEIKDNRVRATIIFINYDERYPVEYSYKNGTYNLSNLYPFNTSKSKLEKNRGGYLFCYAIAHALVSIGGLQSLILNSNSNSSNDDW